MRSNEYIGVSGVVNKEQQNELEQMFVDAGLDNKRTLQLGIKATHTSQYLGVENKYGREWYPVGREIDDALSINTDTYTTGIAQIYFDNEKVFERTYRDDFLLRALGAGAQRWLTGVQFDMLPWHSRPDIAHDVCSRVVDTYCLPSVHDRLIVLQCQGEIMDAHTPRQIATMLGQLPLITHVLFDSSCGRGKKMNAEDSLPYIDAVYTEDNLQHLGVAVAGGLDAEVVRTELAKVVARFPEVSWDAEGRLHPVETNGKRPLNMRVCREYIDASAELLR
ncbi:hypothetical protein EOL96_00630 [Candidatus Saccharibacteria bacterium]|nr:hypothetical protein [Candidatus Saccharibacteria bacterium]